MPLIHQIKCKDNCVLGFWQISETREEVEKFLTLDEREQEAMQNFKNERRKLQWLCTRALLKSISDSQKKIIYNESGKPFLLDASNNISISHSEDLVGIILSKNHEVGLDIELISERVNKIADRFLSDLEKKNIKRKNRNKQLYAYWCAKEALFKIFGEKEIPFDKNIVIHPFELEETGNFKGTIMNETRKEDYTLQYFTINDYMVVWTKK
ncbi:MAG: 4'-phosphopantetheinyl transferase superfamily protein [Bacteroidales bacterium]|nr:4'-phosphopantetheinyl transferase superfamily protein [Bacteroidales bacterium]